MENSFNVPGIRIGEKGAVVAGVIFGPFAGAAVADVARLDPCSVERVDGFLVGGFEGEVEILG
ncbi:hypothetical protein, partial [Gaiella sp.]|uniref:hypothetical protein n=1 Tax=Gaiella sp. TaxID=2663207 RepID=UPI003982E912